MKKFLKGQDDEFVKFLENEDPELLDFEDEDLNESDGELENEADEEPTTEFVADENHVSLENKAEEDDDDGVDLEAELSHQAMSKGLKKWAKSFESSTGNLSTCIRTMRAFCKVESFRIIFQRKSGLFIGYCKYALQRAA